MIKLSLLLKSNLTDVLSKNTHLTDGVVLDKINTQIKELEDEWERLDSQGTGFARQSEINRELQKLHLQKNKWDDLYNATNVPSPGIATIDNRLREASVIDPPVILGAINASHEVESIKGEDETSRHPFKYNTWTKWRYVPEIQYLSWWEKPDETEDMMVRDYLERHGYKVDRVNVITMREEIGQENKLLKEYFTNASQAILTSEPRLYFTEKCEDTHLAICQRLYPEEMELATLEAEQYGYGNTEEDLDAQYFAANSLSKKHGFARVVIENGNLIFNTQNHIPLTNKQLKFLKDYCIENGLELVHSMGMRKQYIDLMENKRVIMEGKLEETAEDFIKQIIKGTEWEGIVYACGGYVRDQISGRDAKDLDIVVDKENGGILFSNWITKKIGNYKEHSNPVTFEKFGTSKFNLNGITHNGINLNGFEIEAVMPRSEKYTAGSRHPEVQSTNLKGDAERRDITYNSLYKNISTGEILDLTGKGIEDLKNGIIRTPIDPDKTFKDDPLRQLRIVRFYAKYGHEIPLYIIKSLKRNAGELKNISAERIQSELNKMLVTTRPEKALKLLKITGLLDYIIPEFKSAYKLGQNKFHKSDVWMHSIEVMKKTNPELLNRLVSLLHDIGKTKTKTVVDGEVHFYAHEKVGSEMAKEILTRLKYPTEIIAAVVIGIANHMRLKRSGNEGELATDKTLRKFSVDLGNHLETMLDVMEADNASHEGSHTMPNQIPNIRARIEKLKNTIPAKNAKLPVTGEDLKALKIPAGPIYKEILDTIRDAIYENPKLTRDEAFTIVQNILKNI